MHPSVFLSVFLFSLHILAAPSTHSHQHQHRHAHRPHTHRHHAHGHAHAHIHASSHVDATPPSLPRADDAVIATTESQSKSAPAEARKTVYEIRSRVTGPAVAPSHKPTEARKGEAQRSMKTHLAKSRRRRHGRRSRI